MLSPAKCEPEEATAQSDLHPSPRSKAQSSSREVTKLSNGEMSTRRSTRFNCDSPKDNGGEGTVSKMKSRGKQLTNSCQVRKSPRFKPVDGEIDNVCSVPVTGKFGSRKRKSSSDLAKKESLDSEGLTFKDIAAIAKSLEMEIMSECEDKTNDGEDTTTLEIPAKREVASDAFSPSTKPSNQSLNSNKVTRGSPRLINGLENEAEENLGKSKEQEEPVATRTPSVRSSRLSGVVENGHGETLNTVKTPSPAVRGAKQSLGSNRVTRRSARSTNGPESEGEENLGKSEEQEKPVATRTPSVRSSRLSGVVENGYGETLNTVKTPGPALRGAKTRGSGRLTNGPESEGGEDLGKSKEQEKPVASQNASVTSSRLSGIVENGHGEPLNTVKTSGSALCGSKQSLKRSNPSPSNNKVTRRSPRLKGPDNDGEENLGNSEEQEKPVASRKPSIRSSRLSGIVENGNGETLNTIKTPGPILRGAKQVTGTEKVVQTSEDNNCGEAMKKCEVDGLISSKQELLNSSPGCIKLTVNGSRDKKLRKLRSSDVKHTSSLEIRENGKSNGLTTKATLVEQESMEASLQVKANDCGVPDKVITLEMHAISTEIYLSDSEQPAKKIKKSVDYSSMISSDGDIVIQVASGSSLSSGGNGRLTPDLNNATKSTKRKGERVTRNAVSEKNEINSCFFIGEPIPCEEAQERWRWRYDLKESKRRGQQSEDDEDKIIANVECHYLQANVDNQTFSLGDFVYVKGEEEEDHVGKIVEFFKTTDEESYFRVQWFYRAPQTVMKQEAINHDKRRLFYSTVMNDNPIDCIVSKVTVLQVSPRAGLKPKSIKSDFYFDMEYCVEYSTFRTLRNLNSSENKLECCGNMVPMESTGSLLEDNKFREELHVLDLYSGCGGMSTGLNLGAKISGVDVVTKWSVDMNVAACHSLKLNHPHTQVRNDAAGDFLLLLKEWEKLCKRYVLNNKQNTDTVKSENSTKEISENSSSSDDDSESEEFEVEKLIDICYGDPDKTGEPGLKYRVRWKGYGTDEDSWEPADELSNCEDSIREFVTSGYKSKILPLPGGVGVICGGPPCQGISGYNRYRDVDTPLNDERNQQIIVFMDIVEYLKPTYVLMENVCDILRLDKGSLGRYALSRLVNMRYQARLGIMTAGCYGLAQFRSRVFMWGADPNRKLPPFPLPTHDVIVRYGCPQEFQRNVVAYDEGQPRNLEKALVLKDAISDLPPVTNDENRENMSYESPPETDFQRYIRSSKHDMTGSANDKCTKGTALLLDHRPFHMYQDDYLRVCQIPKRKGANFRDLPGIIVKSDNSVCRDPSMEPVLLPSGRFLVPEYTFTFQQGKSKRPFARLWWDETVPTVLTVPSCHNQTILHPEQDRMLTIRESARLQGFPDYFQFLGTTKERYCQIGNAVAVSVSRALGYSLGLAFRGVASDEHLIKLPQKFSHSTYLELQETIPH